MKSVVRTPEVVGDFTVHDRPAGEASGCTGVPETPQLEVIQPNQMSEIESVQDPMPDTWQDTPNSWDVYSTAQDTQAQPRRAPICLYDT